jgi:hypothetical protein
MSQPSEAPKSFMQKLLDVVEKVGNKVPHPMVIFLVLIAIVMVLSHILHLLGTSLTTEVIVPERNVPAYVNPDSYPYAEELSEPHRPIKRTTAVQSLLTMDGLRFMYVSLIPSFMSFTGVGLIIVAPALLTPLGHLEFLKHDVNQRQLASDAEDVGHFDLLGVGARGEDGKVGASEPEQPVPKHVVPMPLKDHSAHIKDFFPFPDGFPHPQAAAGEDHVLQTIDHQEHDEPDQKKKHGNRQVAKGVHVDIEELQPPEDRVPHTKDREENGREAQQENHY